MVILGWGWVGWGGAMTFMSTCTHTSCYVIVMFSCTCTHTRHATLGLILGWGWVGWGGAMLRSWSTSLALAHTRHATLLLCSLALAHTHTRHATLWLSWGGVGWGGAMTFMSTCTHTHTSCYVIVMFSCTCTRTSCYVMVILSCTCSHTSCYVMVIFSCTCSHTSCYAMVIFSSTCAHTSCAPLFLQMETVLGNHMPKVWKSNMPKCLIKTKNGPNKCEEPPVFSCPLWQGRKSLTDGGKAWKIIFPKAFQDGCIMESTQKNTLNWKSLSWVTVGENLWDHWHLTDFSKNFARPSKQWSASEKKEKKCCIPKKTRTYVKRRSSFGDFQNPIFHVNMRKNYVSL